MRRCCFFVVLVLLFGFSFVNCRSTDLGSNPLIVLQFPPYGHVFRDPKNVIVAFTVANFRMPQQGSIHMEVNGNFAGNYSKSAEDAEGNIRMHMVMPELPIGQHSVAIFLADPEGIEIEDTVQTTLFDVDPDAALPSGGSVQLEQLECVKDAGACRNRKDCNGRGECAQGACLCDANWVGEHCTHHLLTNASYFPDVEPQHLPSLCMKSKHWENGSVLLVRELEDLHGKPRCFDPNHQMYFGAPHHGLGGNMHVLSSALTRAHSVGKAMVILGSWAYGHPYDNCRMGDEATGCFFEPYSQCLEAALDIEESAVTVLVEGMTGGYFWEGGYGDIRDPPPYVHSRYQQHGLLWWRANLLQWLMRTNAEWVARIRKIKNTIKFQKPIIGLHVRHGDACTHGHLSNYRPPCEGIDRYMEQVHKMKQMYGVRRVFVSTDDDQVLRDLAQYSNEYEFVHMRFDRGIFDSKWFIEYRMAIGAVDAQLVAHSSLIDILLLRECDYLVGTFISHFSRLALELIAAEKGFVPPFVSLDLPYGVHGEHLPWSLHPKT